jgi:hypothetical protein
MDENPRAALGDTVDDFSTEYGFVLELLLRGYMYIKNIA